MKNRIGDVGEDWDRLQELGILIDKDDDGRWTAEETLQMWLVLGFSVLLIYMVTAGLFESLMAPLVVLFTLPLALIGVFLIFFYTDATFTRTAFIGTIMMGGIVVNNAILVVYHIGELREEHPQIARTWLFREFVSAAMGLATRDFLVGQSCL